MITAYLGKEYGLDYIAGAYDSCVAFFSYYRPSAKYRGECCRIRRLDTGAERDIGFVNGYIDHATVNMFCAGTTGLVTTIYNSSGVAGKQDAIQLTAGNMPIIYESGAFLHDGFKFISADSKYMSITNYAEVNIINPALSTYINTKNNSSHQGYIFSVNLSSGSDAQFSIYNNVGLNFLMNGANALSSITGYNAVGSNKNLINWQDKNSNGLKTMTNGNSNLHTFSQTLNERPYITIGARALYGYYFNGQIKTISIFNSNQYDNYAQLAALI